MLMTVALIQCGRDEEAQDLIEYSLLLGTIALAGAGAIVGMNGILNTLWGLANSNLANASN